MNYNLLSEAVHLLCQGYIELINLPKSEQEVFWLKGANSEHDAKYLAQKWAVERHEQKKQANFSAFFCQVSMFTIFIFGQFPKCLHNFFDIFPRIKI